MFRLSIFCISVLGIMTALLVTTTTYTRGQGAEVINGCIGILTGALRVVNSPSQCNLLLETRISWSKTGPQGTQGPPGPQGSPGPQGAQGPPGPSTAAGSVCETECVNGQLRFHHLNEDGVCTTDPTFVILCEPYTCANATSCRQSCQSDSECATGFICESAARCVPEVYTCVSDTTLRTPSGATVSCLPFSCQGDRCRTSCATDDDCPNGFICDFDNDDTCIEVIIPGP